MVEGDVFEPAPGEATPVRRRAVLVLLVMLAGVAPAACSDSKDEGSGSGAGPTTTESPSAQASRLFCQTAEQVGASGFSVDPANREKILRELTLLAVSAPSTVKTATENLRAGTEGMLNAFDQVRAAAQSQDVAQQQQLAQQAQEASAQVAPALLEVASYLTQRCPGVTLPPLPAPPTGGR